ncbi:L protein [Rose virus R]|uniref:RNA-directed RNA polymerase n=1 Tax=Rose virus R TaxID=2805917 RepID=A0AAE7P736_9RHAB|nr:L protein [Rose virus R]QQZ02079.1 L protein [Rose virus R]
MEDDEIKFMRGIGDFHLRSALQSVSLRELERGIGRKRELRAYNEIKSLGPVVATIDACIIMVIILRSELEIRELIPYKQMLVDLISMEVNGLSWITSKDDILNRMLDKLKSNEISSCYAPIRHKLQMALMFTLASISERYYNIEGTAIKIRDGLPSLRFGKLVVYLTGELIGVRGFEKDVTHVISLDMFRMIVDKASERENVLLMSQLGWDILPEVYLKEEAINKLFDILDNHLLESGNKGYEVLKAYEAMVLGQLIALDSSSVIDTSSFLESTKTGISGEYHHVVELLLRHTSAICRTHHHFTQVIGLFRLWGHPIIDGKKGLEKVKRIGTEDKEKLINVSQVPEIAGRKFKEIFFINYFKRNNCYPEITACDVTSSYILECINENTLINTKSVGYCFCDWDMVDPMQLFQIPKTFNLSMIVADTAISPTRGEIRDADKKGESILDPMIRRGVLKWMKDGIIDCHELLTSVNKNTKGLDREFRIIGVYPKEREMNITPRMFALMSLMMRSYIVITENMLSNSILDYIPGITMTYNLLELSKEMINVTKRQSSKNKNSRTFCINMDFEKWNLNMRKLSTYFVFLVLGKLFGLSHLFNRTYDIFRNSLIYLADGSYIPKFDDDLKHIPDESGKSYSGHIGGFEGLRQKGWTIFTVTLIAYICDKEGADYKLMGQGDNQVLMVTIYSRAAASFGVDDPLADLEIQSKLQRIRTALEDVFGEIGLPLKPLETWVSEHFFSYGKFHIYRGIPCASSYKRASRVFGFSNEDMMTLSNAMGAITANSQSCAMSDVHPAMSYILAKWQHLLCVGLFLKYHPLIGESPVDFNELPFFSIKSSKGVKRYYEASKIPNVRMTMMAIVTIPRTLGGYNTVSYFDMIMRGFSDPPTKDMQFLFIMANQAKGAFKAVLRNFISVIYSPETEYSFLIQDPTSLNLLTPPTSLTVIKKMIHKTISSIKTDSIFAEWFKEVLNINDKDKMRELSNSLTDTNQVNPRLLHDILGASLYGYSDSITSKVDKTVTLSRMTLNSEDIVKVICKGEIRYLQYFLWRCEQSSGEIINWRCPSEYVRMIRNKGWQKKIIGISTPFPFHFMSHERAHTRNHDQSYIEGVTSERVLQREDVMFLELGNSLPYLGSVTKEKIHGNTSRLAYGSEPLISRPVKLMRAIGWFISPDSPWVDILVNLLKAVTDLDPDEVIFIPEEVKGSMIHRYSDMALKHGSLWMSLYGPATHVSMSTNTFLEYAKGTKNVTLHFQALLCLIQYSMINRALSKDATKLSYFKKGCEHCITELIEMDDQDAPSVPSELIPTMPDNPYLYISKDEVQIENLQRYGKYLEVPLIGTEEVENLGLITTYLEEILSLKIVSKWSISSGVQSDHGLQDIHGIPRTVFLRARFEHTFRECIKVYWMSVSSSEMRSGFYASWRSMKSTVIRRLRMMPLDNFSSLGGFFLWEETLSYMRGCPWVVMPLSYPLTPVSVSTAAKNSIINLASGLNDLDTKQTFIIPDPQIVNPMNSLKLKLLYNDKGHFIHSCQYCHTEIFRIKIPKGTEMSEILQIKCNQGHSVVSESRFSNLRRNSGSIETISDKCPRIMFSNVLAALPTIQKASSAYRSLLSSGMVKGFVDGKTLTRNVWEPCNEYEWYEFHTSISVPTKALYRGYDILSSISEFPEGCGFMVLGDGYGYTSMICKMLFPGSKVLSWTLIDSTESLPHSLHLARPPTHMYFDEFADNSFSLYEISDISNPEFPKSFKRAVEMGYEYVFSEIELVYSPERTEISVLIDTIISENILGGIVKIMFDDPNDILLLCEQISSRYMRWEVRETISVYSSQKVVWLIFFQRSKKVTKGRYFCSSTVASFQDNIQTGMNTASSWSEGIIGDHYSPWTEIETSLMKSGLNKSLYSTVDYWMGESGIVSWRQDDFTQMFYEIKTGRKPQSIFDVQGNPVHYMFSEQEEQLFIKLMTLSLSMITDMSLLMDTLRSNDGYSLVWVRKGESHGSRLTYYFNPVITKDEQRFWTPANRKEILKYLPLIKMLRWYSGCSVEFSNIGNSINFRYVPSHVDRSTMNLCLPISKITARRNVVLSE